MEIYLVRHTTPSVDLALCYGQTDLDLADSFESEAAAIKEKLPLVFDAVYSSPLQRCAKLAGFLTQGPVHYDARIMEISFGEWELKPWDDIGKDEIEHWAENLEHRAPPGGESLSDLFLRVNEFIDEITKMKYDRVLIVTHGGVLRSVLARVLEMPVRNIFRFKLSFGDAFLFKHSPDSQRLSIRQIK
ncbi:MAG: alpha-ribazole phosphatase [Chloroherpetonaceae bacterium]|nr:alpha-ribazole phosphatase [Chloroherpetonaceae bacterium]